MKTTFWIPPALVPSSMIHKCVHEFQREQKDSGILSKRPVLVFVTKNLFCFLSKECCILSQQHCTGNLRWMLVLNRGKRRFLERQTSFVKIQGCTHCNTLQHTATHCNTLQHTATHCNTLHHMS